MKLQQGWPAFCSAIKNSLLFPLIAFLLFSQTSFAANISYNDAVTMRESGYYSDAEKSFQKLIKKDPKNSELWFQLGLAQRFQNKLDEALISQKTALKISPKNNDARIEAARILFWQKNYDESRALLGEVLQEDPKNLEAMELSTKIDVALLEKKEGYLWQAIVGHQHSRFSRVKQDSWAIDYAQLNRFINSNNIVHARFENIRRFKMYDQYFEAGLTHIFDAGFNAGIIFGRAPNADFYPRNRIEAMLEKRILHSSEIKGDTWLTANAQYNNYPEFDIYVLKPGIRYFFSKNFSGHLQYIEVIDETKSGLRGWSLRLDWQTPFTPLRVFGGYAEAPEVLNGITIDTKTEFVGLAYDINKRLTTYLSYSRDDRENSFIRKTFDASIAIKF